MGALVTYSEVRQHSKLEKMFPLLASAARETGAVAIQNRGTIGGNIANASPAADTPPALLVYDAQIDLASVDGVRSVSYSKFHLGYKKMDLKADEIVAKVRIPKYQGKIRHYYRKVGTRKAQAISKICFAGILEIKKGRVEKVGIGLGSVGPIPLRCFETEAFLQDQKLNGTLLAKAKEILLKEITPIDDIRSTGEYRKIVTGRLLEEFLCGTGSLSSRN